MFIKIKYCLQIIFDIFKSLYETYLYDVGSILCGKSGNWAISVIGDDVCGLEPRARAAFRPILKLPSHAVRTYYFFVTPLPLSNNTTAMVNMFCLDHDIDCYCLTVVIHDGPFGCRSQCLDSPNSLDRTATRVTQIL